MSLDKLFYPHGVAVVGSTSRGKLGYELIRQIVSGGYRDVYAVNPKAQGLADVAGQVVLGYNAVAEIGRNVDLAVIASPPSTVAGVLEDCGRAGVKAAMIITAGFSEVGNHAGEVEIGRIAARYGIRFIGPNCAGMVNTRHHLFPTLETRPPAGKVTLVAQSGALGGIFLAWAAEFGLGIAKFVSYGNGADLNEIELLRYLADDPDTEVVALYIESVNDGREFMATVRECTRHKPVVVIKAGRTASGQRATLSHTGSMAGADAVYDAALRQCGAIRVRTVEEMFDVCKGFTTLSPVQGRRVVVVTNSGGPAVLAADWAEEIGLDVAEPSAKAKSRLSEFLPPYCAFKNPIDLTVEGTEEGYRQTLSVLLDEYDAALALNIATPYLDSVALARGICDAAAGSAKPVAASFLPGPVVTEGIDYLEAHGVPNFTTGERAVAALARIAEHYAQSARGDVRIANSKGQIAGRQAHGAGLEQRRLPGDGQILEPEAMAWLRENGIPVPDYRTAATQAQAVQASHELGYPVVMKVVSPDILHKSDVGGVVLNIRDAAAAASAFAKIQAAAAGCDFRGVVIYPLIEGAQEVLLGLSRDPQFGPVVALGLGGIYTEILHDVSLRVAPIERIEAVAMIRELKSLPLLQGVRGQPPCDLETLADVLVSFSQLPFRYPGIEEVDLNPVFLSSDGLVVGDVRVIASREA